MKDITQIDFNEPYAKRVAAEPAKQKVFFVQNGIEYDAAGKACNAKQVKDFYARQAEEAQKIADEAKEAAAAAQAAASEALKASKAKVK